MPNRVILWDFDGTLAQRPGMWGLELAAAIAEVLPGQPADPAPLRPYLSHGFPWHQPEVPHPELNDPEAWWAHITGVLADGLIAAGYEPGAAREIALASRPKFLDPRPYRVFEDTFAVLDQLAAEGWRHVILSNHVPELPHIVEAIGLSRCLEAVISSANIGYEKPHPQAFRLALESAGSPEVVRMVGDTLEADVQGAEAVGIPAILVRKPSPVARRFAADLWAVVPWLTA
jgi:putative hydrolase of the HAD superfamily